MVDHCARIGRLLIAAPGDMPVRSDQDQRALIESAGSGIGNIHDGQRYTALAESSLQP
jgi:hypothetical protein